MEVPECVMPPEQKLDAIRRSRAIWLEIVNDCRDAKRAVKVLTAVLEKLSKKFTYHATAASRSSAPQAPPPTSAAFTPANQTNQNVDSLRYYAYFTEHVGLGMPPSEESPSNSDSLMQDNFLDVFSTDLTMPSDFDWVSLSHVIVT